MRPIVAMLALAAAGCAAPLQRFESTRLSMGVQARVVLYVRDGAAADAATAAAFARLDQLEQAMSDYRPDSELSRLAERVRREPVPLSDDLFPVLAAALRIARETDGAYDPTLGPLVALWREARRTGVLPDSARIAGAMDQVGWRHVEIDEAARTARITRDGVRLDLGGIGKGFAAYEVVKLLRSRGARRCLVALAGDIAVGDPPPGRTGWVISIAPTPGRGATGHAATVTIADACVSTSGDAEQFVEIGGVRYSHILDPATGLGLTRPIQATVVAPDGAAADALATALCVAGHGRAAAVLARFPGAEAMVIESPGHARVEYRSPGFPAR